MSVQFGQNSEGRGDEANHRLLLALAEEMRLPLLQARQEAELHAQKGVDVTSLQLSVQQGLWLVDAYVLQQQLQQQLVLSPVSVSSVLYDVTHALQATAKQYDCTLKLDIEGKYMPVISDRAALQAALMSIGLTFLQAADTPGQELTLSAHKTAEGIQAGIYSDQTELSDKVFADGKALFGKARQPLKQVTAHAAAGVFLADSLLQTLQTQLKVAQHNNQRGLAVLLTPSTQLALV